MEASARQKSLGAFYTPAPMAAALADWAIRSSEDTVLDPSFGGLAFLSEAQRRLSELGAASPAGQLYGADVDPVALAQAAPLAAKGATLVRRDFLRLSPRGRVLPRTTAVLGNPPYVRYQSFTANRERGRALAARQGIRLTRLASSWAPLLIHAADFVADEGCLAQVLPAELIHSQYADQILDHIRERFGRVSVVMFDEHVFPGAQEEVVLLCAEGRASGRAPGVEVRSCRNLDDLDLGAAGSSRPRPASPHKLLSGLVDPAALDLYDQLAAGDATRRLGDIASVDIGAVTGANRFFVRPAHEVRGVPSHLLREAVSKAAHVPGARLSSDDFQEMDARKVPTQMLVLDGGALPAAVRRLIREGEADGIHTRYKCRVRDPWWVLPSSQVSDPPALFLTYMSAGFPRLVVNEAGALSTNSVHGVRLMNGTDPRALAAAFYSSLTVLSAELVGRSYGGGVLKLEPTEAERLVLARPAAGHRRLLARVDRLLRARDHEAAVALVDEAILVKELGVAPAHVALLRSAARRLRERRLERSRHRAQRGADLGEHAV